MRYRRFPHPREGQDWVQDRVGARGLYRQRCVTRIRESNHQARRGSVATAAEANKQLAVVYDPSSAWLDVVEVALAAQGVTVAGRAQDAEPAIALVEQHRPHLLVADPAGPGIDVLREARAHLPALKAIALGRGSESEQ